MVWDAHSGCVFSMADPVRRNSEVCFQDGICLLLLFLPSRLCWAALVKETLVKVSGHHHTALFDCRCCLRSSLSEELLV